MIFFDRFLAAVDTHRHGGTPSRSWQVAFTAADQWRPTVLSHLLIGMNAHINFDLGVAVAATVPAAELPGFVARSSSVPSRLIALRSGAEGDHEVTVYLKGFLARGEKADRFERWLDCHEALMKSRTWGPRAFGYDWPSGQFGKLAAGVGAAKGIVDFVRVARNVRRAVSLGNLGMIVGEQALTLSALFVRQYWVATRNAQMLAEDCARQLAGLAEGGTRVRVVAHSLGCRQVIEAVSTLSRELRPAEIHLCAPAVREDDVADKLGSLAREATYLYYTEKDRVLDLGFTPLARGRALGYSGPRKAYQGLTAVDVGEHFDFFVHGEYKSRFEQLVLATEDLGG